MDRKEFLSQIGLGAAGLVMFGWLRKEGCAHAPSNVDVTIDLTNSTYAALLTPGGYIYTSNGIIVALTKAGTYIAVSEYCTHQGVAVNYNEGLNEFTCPAHGSVFSATGSVVNGPAASPLKQYTVTQSGKMLTITG
jgi:cytochrome b6-f complex iron-sulfur subunit